MPGVAVPWDLTGNPPENLLSCVVMRAPVVYALLQIDLSLFKLCQSANCDSENTGANDRDSVRQECFW